MPRYYRVAGYHDYRVPYEVVVEVDSDDGITDERVGIAVAEIPSARDGIGEIVGEQITSVVEVA